METIAIALREEQLNSLSQTSANIGKLLDDLFRPHTGNYQKLAYELQREFKQGGSPDVMRLNFDRIKFDQTTGKGSLRIVLDIDFTFGCEDVRVQKQDQTSEWTFAIDKSAKTFTLFSSPYADSRSTADEF